MKKPVFVAKSRTMLSILWIFILVGLSLYGRSLHYEFVYDDILRIQANPAIKTLSKPLRFFTDPSTQSVDALLNQHAYRPLVTLDFACDHFLWGENPWGYRLQNILLHGINAFLVFLFAVAVLDLTLAGAVAAGLIFLVHPIQVEAVVLVVERSNVMSVALLLSATLCWVLFLKNDRRFLMILSLLFFSASLLFREIAFCFPFMMILMGIFLPKKISNRGEQLGWLALFLVIDVLYFMLRWHFIGQIKIASYWGGTWGTNLSNVVRIWPEYLRNLLLPLSQNVHPFYQYTTEFFGKGVIPGLVSFVLYLCLIVLSWMKEKRVSLCLTLLLLFWGSRFQLDSFAPFFFAGTTSVSHADFCRMFGRNGIGVFLDQSIEGAV